MFRFALALILLALSAYTQEAAATATPVETHDTKINENLPSALPPDLLVDGKPVDPLCFMDALRTETPPGELDWHDIELKDCGRFEESREYFSKGPFDRGVMFTYPPSEGGGKGYMQYLYIENSKQPDGSFAVTLSWQDYVDQVNHSEVLRLKREEHKIKPLEVVIRDDDCKEGPVQASMNEAGKLVPSCDPHMLPPELLVDGKPIDPLCFADAVTGEGWRDIKFKGCGKNLIIKKYFTQEPFDRGVMYQYEPDEMGMSVPYTRYLYIENSAQPDGRFAVVVNWSGGGTGSFSSVDWLKRETDKIIHVKSVAGGDRCNGGVVDAYINDNKKFVHSVNITPYDMKMLASQQMDDKDESLQNCAICCYGTARFEDEALVGIKLNEELSTFFEAHPPTETDANIQACFDAQIKAQLETGITQFSPDAWVSFIDKFEKTCEGKTP